MRGEERGVLTIYYTLLFFFSLLIRFFFHPSRNRCASCTVWSWQCFPWNLYFHLRSVAKSSFSHRVKYLDATPFISHIFLEKRKNEDYGVMKKPFNKQQKPTKKKKKQNKYDEETNQSLLLMLEGRRSYSIHRHVSCMNVAELIALFLYDLVTRFPFLHHNGAARSWLLEKMIASVCWQLCLL